MKKKIVILGSTGSIGSNTLDVIKYDENFSVKILSTNKNYNKIYSQAIKFNVKNVIINDVVAFNKAKLKFNNSKIKFHNSFSIIDKLFKKKEIYYSMISVSGLDGLDPSIRLCKLSKNIAIVNKEAIICGWNLILKELQKYKTNFYPIDSEHYSIFSLLYKNEINNINKVFITASGGPFLKYTFNDLCKVNVDQALKHPNWKMGKKISVDSSSMMNKVFEVIEAKKIFNLSYDKIKILIHPQSYVHTLIEFDNGIIKILAHETSMKIPIHNSVYPNFEKILRSKKINLYKLNNLKLQLVDNKKFPLVKILKKLPLQDSLFETVIVSINDFFVFKFLNKEISYIQLINLIWHYANLRKFSKFKKLSPKCAQDVYDTRNYVYENLENSDIKFIL